MAISYNTGTTAHVNNSGTSTGTFTVPAGVNVGDVVIVYVYAFVVTATVSGTVTLTSTATTPIAIGSTQSCHGAAITGMGEAFYFVATASDPGATLTFGATISGASAYYFDVGLAAYSGASTVTPIDVNAETATFSNSNNGTNTTQAATTNTAGDWQIQLIGNGPPNNNTYTVPGGLTLRASSSISTSGVNAGLLLQFADSNGSVGGAGTSIGGTSWTCGPGAAGNDWWTTFTIGLAPAASSAFALPVTATPPGYQSPAAWQQFPYPRLGQTVTISGGGGVVVPKPSLAGTGGVAGLVALPASQPMPPGLNSPAAWQLPPYRRLGQTITISGSGGVAVPKPSLAGTGSEGPPPVALRPQPMPPGYLSPAAWQQPAYRRLGQTITIQGGGGVVVPKPALSGNGAVSPPTVFPAFQVTPPGYISPAAWQAPRYVRLGQTITIAASGGVVVPKPSLSGQGLVTANGFTLPASPLMPPGALSPAAWQHPQYRRLPLTVTIQGAGGVTLPKPSVSGRSAASTATPQQGSWWGLDSVFKQSRQEFESFVSRPPMACPVDGEPLRYAPATKSGSGIERYCPWCGWSYPRDWVPPSRPMPW
jgi:hypothetical protein